MRLTSTDIERIRAAFREWLAPDAAERESQSVMDGLTGEELFNQPGIEFVREVWAGGRFGAIRGAASVRLISDERPDIELLFSDGSTERYELVEADVHGRKRGLEYREAERAGGRVEHWPIEKWATPQQAADVLRAAAEKKAAKALDLSIRGKAYPAGTRLLIYLNISDFGIRQTEIESQFAGAVDPARQWFSSTWILWKLRAYEV
jgi:hypothetical protein